jgi:hypothetical protein
MVPSTDQQETMFEEPAGYDPAYEPPFEEDGLYEAADHLPEHSPEDIFDHRDEPPAAVQAAQVAQATQLESTPAGSAAPAGWSPAPDPVAASEPLPVLTVDDFAALEERVLRAVDLVRRERQARTAAEEHAAALTGQLAQLKAETSAAERLRQEVDALRAEREQVRLRVERLLSQLDALEI